MKKTEINEKIAELSNGVLLENKGLTDDNSATNYTISDLYSLVKTYDKDFHAGKPVDPVLLDKNGEPKVFYHGTNEKFTVTIDDLSLIPYIVEHYDKVFVVNHNGNYNSIYYVKALENNVVYYLEQATEVYGNEKLLINKQMVKTSYDTVLDFKNLKKEISKKEGFTKFTTDLMKIRDDYAQSGVSNPSANNNITVLLQSQDTDSFKN